jgi:hypothetical protein
VGAFALDRVPGIRDERVHVASALVQSHRY